MIAAEESVTIQKSKIDRERRYTREGGLEKEERGGGGVWLTCVLVGKFCILSLDNQPSEVKVFVTDKNLVLSNAFNSSGRGVLCRSCFLSLHSSCHRCC